MYFGAISIAQSQKPCYNAPHGIHPARRAEYWIWSLPPSSWSDRLLHPGGVGCLSKHIQFTNKTNHQRLRMGRWFFYLLVQEKGYG